MANELASHGQQAEITLDLHLTSDPESEAVSQDSPSKTVLVHNYPNVQYVFRASSHNQNLQCLAWMVRRF